MIDPGPAHWIRYFAYGSNMSSARLRARVPGVRPLGLARLEGWTLRFNKHGRDGTAKANIEPSEPGRVWGVLHGLPPEQRGPLDAAEDLGRGYAARWVRVLHPQFGSVRALTYVGLLLCEDLAVAGWYLEHCLRGAREHGLPEDYVAWLARQAEIGVVQP